MSKENEKIQEDKLSPAKEFTSDLKSRQSVRA
jgi:hypothetical protein